MESKRCILLAGAPGTADLDWHEHVLANRFDHTFDRVLGDRAKLPDATQSSSTMTSSILMSRWRVVELDTASDGAGAEAENLESSQFLSFGDDFLEHSVAVLDDLVSSQILRPGSSRGGEGNNTIDITTSFVTSDSSSSFSETSKSPDKNDMTQTIRLSGAISNLRQIPTAEYISRILPQTMTVNLLAGVVAVAPARTVRLRRSNTEMEIIELVVGDDTRAGFTVSFWLVPGESQRKPADDLREILRTLRAGNVVLLQNVAVSSFRNCVYGQSLSKRFARNSTLITTMDDVSIAPLPPGLHAKLQRVRDWISDFVGVEKKAASSVDDSQDHGARSDLLPPDTQD